MVKPGDHTLPGLPSRAPAVEPTGLGPQSVLPPDLGSKGLSVQVHSQPVADEDSSFSSESWGQRHSPLSGKDPVRNTILIITDFGKRS